MQTNEPDVPGGILIGPEGMPIPEGTELLVGIPPALDLEEATALLDRPMVALCGIARSANPSEHPTFEYVRDAFLLPEIARRHQATPAGVPVDGIGGALVVFPSDVPGERCVYLNGEVRVKAGARMKYTGVEAGAPIRVSDLYDLSDLRLEGVREGTDGFFWVTQEPGRWALYFDLVPLAGDQVPDDARAELHAEIMDAMAQEHLRSFLRHAFEVDVGVQERMAKDGWVPSPALLPEPWAPMCRAYAEGHDAEAEEMAAAWVTRERVDAMLAAWVADEPFTSERPFLERTIRHYFEGDYISAVAVALPRLEGVANRVRRDGQLRAEKNVVKAMKNLDAVSSGATKGRWLRGEVLERFEAFVKRFLDRHTDARAAGPVLERGRHGHAHGASDASVYDRRYALQVLLAFDALHFILRR